MVAEPPLITPPQPQPVTPTTPIKPLSDRRRPTQAQPKPKLRKPAKQNEDSQPHIDEYA